MSKRKTPVLDLVGVLLALIALFGGAVLLIGPFRAALIVAAGRAPGCSFSDALKTRSSMDDHTAMMERIARDVRVRERDDAAGLELWDTPHGPFWMAKGERELMSFLVAEQEEKIYGAGEWGVKPNDIVLDCGAHVGVFSRRALAAGAKLVVAVEPAPGNLECLRRNLAAEIASGRVILIGEGVWDKPGKLPFHINPKNSAGNSLLTGDDGHGHGESHHQVTIEVPLTTIDSLAQRLNLERVDYIKMDIEGAEQNALAGARGTIAKYHPRMAIATYHTLEDSARVPVLAKAAWPQYQTSTGPCQEQDFRIRPQTILFR